MMPPRGFTEYPAGKLFVKYPVPRIPNLPMPLGIFQPVGIGFPFQHLEMQKKD